jgi:hypothetical protein
VSFQTLIGFAAGPVGAAAGFINGVRGELTGEVINYVAGKQIGQGVEASIEFGAKQFKTLYPSLTEDEARHLAGGSLLSMAATAEGSSGIKQIFRHLDKKDFDIKLESIASKTEFDTKSISNDNSALESKILDKGEIKLAKAKALAKTLPDNVPEGRIDYSQNYLDDLDNFIPDTVKLHNGKLKEDLVLLNYHDIDKNIGFGHNDRSMKWATHISDGNKMLTVDDIHQHLALVSPDWGKRDAVSIIRIPAGTDVIFFSGQAADQASPKTLESFKGGGFQVRFKTFDEKWIVETKKLK